jgi:hypothetical protein
MYTNAVFVVQINGHMSSPISNCCSIRQGRPLRMMLFALCINLLVECLEEDLQGLSLTGSNEVGRSGVLRRHNHPRNGTSGL